jgi:hypothetical protein
MYFIKYYYDDQIEDSEVGGACSTHRSNKNAYKVLVGISEGIRRLEKFRR